MSILVFGKSVVGASHVKIGKGMDDSYGSFVKGDSIIAVTADGAGSAPFSKKGADLVVSTFISKFKDSDDLGDPETFITSTLETAREEIKNASQQKEYLAADLKPMHKPSLKDYATTVLVFIGIGDKWYTSHIGDGAIVIYNDERFEVVSQPYNSEYVNETVFLTSDNYMRFLDLKSGNGFQKVFIFTDGIQRGVLEPENGILKPFLPFFEDISKFSDSVISEEQGSNEIEKLLLSDQFSEISDDDKTLVVVVKRDKDHTL